MNFKIDKEGLINNESFIDELCAFFKENNISDINYTPGFGNNELELKQLGYSNWEFVGFGKHRAHNDEIAVIEKANHKILVGIDGLTIHGKKFDVQKLKSSFEFNNIWC